MISLEYLSQENSHLIWQNLTNNHYRLRFTITRSALQTSSMPGNQAPNRSWCSVECDNKIVKAVNHNGYSELFIKLLLEMFINLNGENSAISPVMLNGLETYSFGDYIYYSGDHLAKYAEFKGLMPWELLPLKEKYRNMPFAMRDYKPLFSVNGYNPDCLGD